MKSKFFIVFGSASDVGRSLEKVATLVNEKMAEGYEPYGLMLQTSEKKPTDAFTQFVFIQPMILVNELRVIE